MVEGSVSDRVLTNYVLLLLDLNVCRGKCGGIADQFLVETLLKGVGGRISAKRMKGGHA